VENEGGGRRGERGRGRGGKRERGGRGEEREREVIPLPFCAAHNTMIGNGLQRGIEVTPRSYLVRYLFPTLLLVYSVILYNDLRRVMYFHCNYWRPCFAIFYRAHVLGKETKNHM
jgi:hypothetical protein